MNTNGHRVGEHFENREPVVRDIYKAIIQTAKKFGPVQEDPKKTSIHLVRKTAFAGIATRKTGLILTVKSDSNVVNKRIARSEQASAHRWHLEIRLDAPEQVDQEITAWLARAYQIAG